MNDEEQANYEKLKKDLSVENLSDQEIVEMWKAPAIQQIEDGLSNFKLENFLMSKGVSRSYAPKGVKWIKREAQRELSKSRFTNTLANMIQSMSSLFKFKR